jgi:hypothetical protein
MEGRKGDTTTQHLCLFLDGPGLFVNNVFRPRLLLECILARCTYHSVVLIRLGFPYCTVESQPWVTG